MTGFVIVGGGLAGHQAALELRRLDPRASVTLISEEAGLPYDRTPLSKEVLHRRKQVSELSLPGADNYAASDITYIAGRRVVALDRRNRTVMTDTGDSYGYDRLLIATGSRARRLAIDGATERVAYLRTSSDALALARLMVEGKHLAVIGAGFIGLEVAAAARSRGCRVTVLEAGSRVLSRGIPDLVSAWAHALHTSHGVGISLDCGVSQIEWSGGGAVLTTSSKRVIADAVVAGIGVAPNVELAEQAGLHVEDGLAVDAYCRTSDPDIFGAGEVTCHPVRPSGRRRVESWKMSGDQGIAAARSMAGHDEPFEEVPWLWSDQYDANIQTVGFPAEAATLYVAGDPASPQWTMVGTDEHGAVTSGVAVNRGRDASLLRRAVKDGSALSSLEARIGLPVTPLAAAWPAGRGSHRGAARDAGTAD